MSKTWFVTGSSRGFGRLFVEKALQRGDKVAATARDASTLKDLVETYGDSIVALDLDVTDRSACFAAVQVAHEKLGSLDVVVNNAGYGHFGAIEELSEAEIRDQMETNLFGALWVTQAALPILRAQGRGHILQISSVGGVCAFPLIGAYHASKWALEGFSDALSQEVAGFGIKVTIVEPSGFSTDWGGSSAMHSEGLEAYEPFRQAREAGRARGRAGEPAAAADALLAVVDMAEPPLRVAFGNMAYDFSRRTYQKRLEVWAAHEQLSRDADGAEG